MTYATPEDVAVELRGSTSLTTEEAVQWQAWIERVERSIERAFRRRGMDLTEQVILEDPTAGDVRDVEVAAVIRKVQNPTWGRTSRTLTRQVDDSSISDTERSEGIGDPLDVSATELGYLLPAVDARAFSFVPYREPYDPLWWLGHDEV